MEVKVGIRRRVLGGKKFWMTDCLEKKPQGIWWVKKCVGIIAIFGWNRFAFVSY